MSRRKAFLEDKAYIIRISKKDFSLKVCLGSEVIREYKIAYGLNSDKKAKLYSGDMRTPEGEYVITEVLRQDAQDPHVRERLKEMNDVYLKAEDGHFMFGHRNTDLGAESYGPGFFRINYPNRDDEKNYKEACARGIIPLENGEPYSIGCGIAIHGTNDRLSIGHLSTSGCVRINNEDIIELSSYVRLNTMVIIS